MKRKSLVFLVLILILLFGLFFVFSKTVRLSPSNEQYEKSSVTLLDEIPLTWHCGVCSPALCWNVNQNSTSNSCDNTDKTKKCKPVKLCFSGWPQAGYKCSCTSVTNSLPA